ncbi:hypothetical protein C8R46DRAFT_1306879 [Mycena filopes]|nr:hypothetical protein C8R46DRAFT_1306879 [Mycena filopes]
MRDVSLDDLAGCNNPDCRAGCGWYEYTSLQPGVSLAMTPCVVCGCRGSQHRENRRQAAPTVPTPAPFIPLATPELPSTSHSASTLPSSSFSSFGGPSFASTSSSGFNAPEPTPPPGFSAGRFGTHPEVVAGGSQPQTSFSATARSLFGSRPPVALSGSQPQRGREPLRGSTAAPPGFRDLADARRADTIAAMRSSGTFHPGMKAQKDADLDRAGSRKRKKRADPSPSQERFVKRKLPKQITCVVILVPFTKDVNRGRCSVPAPHSLVRLEEAGYVKDIIISVDDTENDIRTKVLINFHLPEIADAMTDSNIRLSGPRYRHIVFIALNPAGPNLPLHGVSQNIADNLDHDVPSDEISDTQSDQDSDSDADMGDADETDNQPSDEENGTKDSSAPTAKTEAAEPDRKGKKKASPEASRYDAGFFDDDIAAGDGYTGDTPAAPPPEPKIEKPVVPAAHLRVIRLLRNMHKPEVKSAQRATWWTEHGHGIGSFLLGVQSAQICAGVLVQFLASPTKSVLTPQQIVAFIESSIIQPLSPLTKLGGRLLGATERLGSPEFEAEFESAFAIGPGGLHALAPHILSAYLALPVALKEGAPADVVSTAFDQLCEVSYSLLRCLQHLRFKVPRSQWDPTGGCRELATVLENKDADLPVATEEDFARLDMRLLIAALDKETPNVSEINFLLMDVLGDISNPREMTAERVLKGGEYGMRRFCALVVNRVLDDLDAAHPDYRSVLGSVQGACLGVARKIRNYFKRGGATSAPEPKTTETGTEDGTAGPRTRSRSKRTTGNNDDNSDSMTNTDSLESGWENDYSDGEPDVHVRRAQRHAQRQKPPPQPARPRPRPRPRPKLKTPPIEISSDSESSSSSDTEWQKTYTRWRKRNAAPSTSAAPPPAPAPAPSQSRAQPAWMDPTSLEADDVEDANGLPRRSTARYWQGVMREVVERFPHPEPTRRITMGMLLAPGMTRRRQYHMLCLAYHVDRNVGGGAHWLRIAAILSQILNDTRTYKLDDPRVV